jgi:hypothetical protein
VLYDIERREKICVIPDVYSFESPEFMDNGTKIVVSGPDGMFLFDIDVLLVKKPDPVSGIGLFLDGKFMGMPGFLTSESTCSISDRMIVTVKIPKTVNPARQLEERKDSMQIDAPSASTSSSSSSSSSSQPPRKIDTLTIFAKSPEDALEWKEAIDFVVLELKLPIETRSKTAEELIAKGRFNFLQTANIRTRNASGQGFFIKDTFQIVGKYL